MSPPAAAPAGPTAAEDGEGGAPSASPSPPPAPGAPGAGLPRIPSVLSFAQIIVDTGTDADSLPNLPDVVPGDETRLTPGAAIAALVAGAGADAGAGGTDGAAPGLSSSPDRPDAAGGHLPAVGYRAAPRVAAKRVQSFASLGQTAAGEGASAGSPTPPRGASPPPPASGRAPTVSARATDPADAPSDPGSDGDPAVTAPPPAAFPADAALGRPAARSYLDALVFSLWEAKARQGLLLYPLSSIRTRLVPGPWGFVAQINAGRAEKKRATEFRVDRVAQAYDGSKAGPPSPRPPPRPSRPRGRSPARPFARPPARPIARPPAR